MTRISARSAGSAWLALSAAIAVAVASGGPAHAASRTYTLTSFDVIRVEAPVRVVVTTGKSVSARADGDQALLDRLRVDVSGRMLSISMERQAGSKNDSGTGTLTLSTNDLRRIVLNGGGSIAVDRMKGQNCELIIGGSGDIAIGDVAVDRLSLSLAGSGRATLAGRAGDAALRVTGPGAVEAGALRVRQLTIDNAGPATVTASADVTARVTTTGSGQIRISGAGACTIANRGTGTVACGAE